MIQYKKIIILALSLFMVNGAVAQNKISFKEFNECNRLFFSSGELMEAGEYEKAIAQLRTAAKSIEYIDAAFFDIGHCYAHLNRYDSALYYVGESFKYGMDWNDKWYKIDTALFKGYLDVLKNKYNQNYPIYTKQLDTALFSRLTRMKAEDQKYRIQKISLEEYHRLQPPIDTSNMLQLREIVSKTGWPNRIQLGRGMIPDPDIFAMHTNHRDNIFFLNLAMKSAEDNLTSWFSPQSIMTTMIWRYQELEGLNKLRYTYFTKEGDLDAEKSYFQLFVLNKFHNDNGYRWVVTLFATYTEPKDKKVLKNHMVALQQIKDFLVKEGMPANIINIDYDWHKVDDDGLGKFYVGFTTTKKN